MCLDGALLAVELWVGAHGDGGRQELSGLGAGDGTHDPASVDTVCRDDALDLLREVRSGESERATTLEAVADGAADTVQVTEHAGGTGGHRLQPGVRAPMRRTSGVPRVPRCR